MKIEELKINQTIKYKKEIPDVLSIDKEYIITYSSYLGTDIVSINRKKRKSMNIIAIKCDDDEIHDFFQNEFEEYFYTEKDYRKEKIIKLNYI